MKKILIIDDNKYIRIALTDLIEEAGFDAITAEDGDIALEEMKTHKPSLVVLDKKLRGWDGLRLLEEIKKIDGEIPVIMLTAYSDITYAENAIRCGAYAFITKPFNNDEIIGIIKNALKPEPYS